MKWFYNLKLKPYGEIANYKANLVAKGFIQRPGIDFNEVYTLVERLEIIRTVVEFATYKGCKINHLKLKSIFLDGPLKEEIHIKQPQGFEIKGREEKIYTRNFSVWIKHAL